MIFLFAVSQFHIILLNMKTQAIGEISRGGGFTRFIRDIQDSQEPVIVMRNNEPVAITFPVQADLVRFAEAFQSFFGIVRNQIKAGMVEDFELYLMTQLMTGLQAKSILSTIMTEDELSQIEEKVFSFTRPVIYNVLTGSEGKSRLRHLADTQSMKNLSEEGGSVSPTTTARADVSEVKQEELPLGNSSFSPKREKSKKQASSPQKRKIGTKRETSA